MRLKHWRSMMYSASSRARVSLQAHKYVRDIDLSELGVATAAALDKQRYYIKVTGCGSEGVGGEKKRRRQVLISSES